MNRTEDGTTARMSTRARTALAAVTAALCTVLPVLPGTVAHAQEEPGGSELASTMLVLDASGSMTGKDPAGGTKMDAAKDAVRSLVDAAPEGARMGLAAYGTSTGNSDAERAEGCQDVTVLQPPEAVDKAALTAAVDRITPRGFTPIGRSLEVAAEALPQEGPRSIVLVSDGEDTCAPPEPCEVVRTLAGQGLDLVVHTVGFGVDDATRTQLACIAQATGGTYSDAPDAEALQRVLPRVTTIAMRNYQPAGTPITGTRTFDAAPVAVPGQHLDTIGQQEPRYYAVDVPAGATAYFSATVSFPRLRGVAAVDDMNSLHLRTYGDGGEDCHVFEAEQTTDSSDGSALTVATTWTGATEQDTGSPSGDRCKGGGRYYFALEWDRVSEGVPARLPVEVLVGVEPAATDAGPAPAPAPTPFVEPTGAPRPVVGGGSFNVAGTLDGSGSYTDLARRGEFLFYRVRLDWGQALAYRVRFGETPGRGLENVSPIKTRMYAPSREEIDWDFTAYTGTATELPTSDDPLATVPVRYGNREADHEYRTQSVAGWYYVSVQVGATQKDGGAGVPVPIQLDISVTGTAEPGPQYAYDSAEARQAGPFGEGRTLTPAAPAGGNGDAAAPGTGTAATTTEVSTAGWVAAGALGAVVVALVVWFFVRRRPAQPPVRRR